MGFASGKNSNFECQRCGMDFPYSSMLVEDGTKFRVCQECFDAQDLKTHPQNKITPKLEDPEALERASPQQARVSWESWTIVWEDWGRTTGTFTIGNNWEDLGKA